MHYQVQDQRKLAPAIESLLDRLRRRIRAFVWIEGVAVGCILLGACFWASLAFDWIFEPPVWLRIGLLVAVGCALGYLVFRFILRRAFVRFADRSMALLIERKFGTFHDSLLTSVELGSSPAHAADFSPEMLAETQRDALAKTDGVDLHKVLNTRPVMHRAGVALALVASIAVFAVAANSAFAVWARRSLLLSSELWPRKTHLTVDGVDRQGRIKVARGADLTLVVKADAAPGRQVPELVYIRHLTSDRRRENMSRQGEAVAGRDAFQNYSHTFKGVLESIEFYVMGGDDRVGPLRLEVVDSPTISQMVLHCEYPAYIRRAPRAIPVTGLMQLPRGTRVVIEARSNKDLVEAQVADLADEKTPATKIVKIAASSGSAARSFKLALGPLNADKLLQLNLVDTDGIRSREPIRLVLSATADEPPQVAAQLQGIGTAITNRARLPASGEVSDEYGLDKLWFEFRVDEAQPRQSALRADAKAQTKVAIDEAFDVSPLKLKPKQKLHLAIQAADNYALGTAPNIGASQRYLLEVVTPEQLRSMLESRELMLRRRFETLIQEFTDTRDSLAKIELGGKPAGDKPSSLPKAPQLADRVEPGDEKPAAVRAEETADPAKALALRRVQAQRVLQNTERSAHETLGVASAFDDIRAELINNRVDTEELKTRLKDGISDPLRRLVGERFSKFADQLKKLDNSLNDANEAPTAQAVALREADAILVEMRQVLDRMLELETFNEVLDLLRDIIRSQETITQQTKGKQKQKLRDLLEE